MVLWPDTYAKSFKAACNEFTGRSCVFGVASLRGCLVGCVVVMGTGHIFWCKTSCKLNQHPNMCFIGHCQSLACLLHWVRCKTISLAHLLVWMFSLEVKTNAFTVFCSILYLIEQIRVFKSGVIRFIFALHNLNN